MPNPDSRDLARRLQGLNLYLVGMMGAGKSAVGPPLAQALGYRFIDADTTVEKTAGQTIPEIFAEAGEEGFRALESAVLNELSRWHSLVVATGGGVVTRRVNWGPLQQGVVIWLDAPEALLMKRLQGDPNPRPLLADPDPPGRLRDLLAKRRPRYAQADLHVMQQGESPEALAGRVLEALPRILKDGPKPPKDPISLLHGDGHTSPNLNG